MKILYGVCGEGFGHSSRAIKIIEHLKKDKHEILVLTYGRAFNVLKKYNSLKVKGLEIKFKHGKISYDKTIDNSIKAIIHNIKNWKKIKKEVDYFNPDICITDMEPLVPIIRYWKKLPLISIDNQHRLTHLKLKIPKKYYADYLIAKNIVESFVKRADYFIILSFIKKKTKTKEAIVVNPVIRSEILKLKPKKENFILVYVTKPYKNLLNLLEKINQRFTVYGYNNIKNRKNLTFKKLGPGFIDDLEKCKAIIGSAGFSLISESIYLKKPYLALPLTGQFEQNLNALFLKDSGIGDFSDNLNEYQIINFLNNLKKYENRLKNHNYDSDELLHELDKIIKKLSK